MARGLSPFSLSLYGHSEMRAQPAGHNDTGGLGEIDAASIPGLRRDQQIQKLLNVFAVYRVVSVDVSGATIIRTQ